MKKTAFAIVMLLGLLPMCIGCNAKPAGTGQPAAGVQAHAHPTEGPHHGDLVELGDEKYHAEITHSDDTVTVYILDKSARNAVPINGGVTINAVNDGQPEQFVLEATPEATDNANESSRFVLKNPDLVARLADAAAAPKLVVTIDGTPYRGEIHHDHAGHDHAEHDNAAHDHEGGEAAEKAR